MDNKDDIDVTVIALDTQKAFDYVNHQCTESAQKIGQRNFVPILKLLH
jgi:hypothetical protein